MRGRDTIGMDSQGKRRRSHDRLSDLPDSLLHVILSGLGSRQAVQTSALSRRWRQLWHDVPCVDIDEREFVADAWERFEDFADGMLTSIPRDTQLDAFRLHLVTGKAGADRWIRRGLQHVPGAVHIRAARHHAVIWQPHVCISPGSSPCAAGFTRRLTTLHLVGVSMVGFVERLGEYCPVLEHFHVERCKMYTDVVASPMLKSLAILDPYFYGDNAAAPLRITAPGLTCIRLEMSHQEQSYSWLYPCFGVNLLDPEPLPWLAEASIGLTDMDNRQLNNHQEIKAHKLICSCWKPMCRFLALLPNLINLRLSAFSITALLDDESQELPVLHNLKTLILEECDVGHTSQALTSILWNTLSLEKLGLYHCMFLAPRYPERRKRRACFKPHRSTLLWYENLKSIEIKLRQEDAPHVVKILSEISKEMPTAQWLRIKTSHTCV